MAEEKVLTPEEEAAAAAEFFKLTSGEGFEGMGGTDFAPPFLVILQALSPQLKPNDPLYMLEARQGQILNTASGKLYNSVHVIPLRYEFRTVVWKDRNAGGGFVDSLPRGQEPPPDQLTQDPKTGEIRDKLGHILKPTAYYLVQLEEEDAKVIIAMASTQLKVSRKWNSLMQGVPVPGNPELTAPMYACRYHLRSVIETKGPNSWFSWSVSSPELITDVKLLTKVREVHQTSISFMPERVLKAIPASASGPDMDQVFPDKVI